VVRERPSWSVGVDLDHLASLVDRRTRLIDGAQLVPGRASTGPASTRSPWPRALDQRGVEARAACYCATLAHHALRLDPAAGGRLGFAVYNNEEEVDRVVAAVRCAA
jgi:hypothetical protein